MQKLVEKTSFLGHKRIVVFEEDYDSGDYSYIDGEWIWGRK
ncbi:MAG: hypothetical protein ACMXYG_05465 [Candidatus Woesearchaeota archaeon]